MILKNLNKSLLSNISLILLIFLIDRISKIYVINLDKKLIGSEIFSSKYLNINLIWNDGIAFGLLAFDNNLVYHSVTGLIILIIIVSVSIFGLIVFVIVKNFIRSKIDYYLIEKNKKTKKDE